MKALIRILALLALCSSGSAMAQGAWDYVELIRNQTSETKLDRWVDVGIICPGEVQDEDCLAFRLPKQLVGDQDVDVVLKGPRARDQLSWTLSGPLGHAFCVQASTAHSCLIELKGVIVEAAAVDAYLSAIFADADQLRTARYAAQSFRDRPVLRWWAGFF